MTEVNVLIDAAGLRTELDSLLERRDEAIGFHVDQLKEVPVAVEEIGFELDDLLAECRFDLVKESVEQVVARITKADDGTLRELADLMEIEFPDGGLPAFGDARSELQRPRMVTVELPSSSEFEKLNDLNSDSVTPVLRDYVQRCADRIRYLLKYFSDELWSYVVWAAKCDRFKEAESAAGESEDVARELHDAFECWIMWLSKLYCDSPSNLGDIGEAVTGTLKWMQGQARS